jgi:hypothetical protein
MCIPVALSSLGGLVNETFWVFGSQIGSRQAYFLELGVLATNFHGALVRTVYLQPNSSLRSSTKLIDTKLNFEAYENYSRK